MARSFQEKWLSIREKNSKGLITKNTSDELENKIYKLSKEISDLKILLKKKDTELQEKNDLLILKNNTYTLEQLLTLYRILNPILIAACVDKGFNTKYAIIKSINANSITIEAYNLMNRFSYIDFVNLQYGIITIEISFSDLKKELTKYQSKSFRMLNEEL